MKCFIFKKKRKKKEPNTNSAFDSRPFVPMSFASAGFVSLDSTNCGSKIFQGKKNPRNFQKAKLKFVMCQALCWIHSNEAIPCCSLSANTDYMQRVRHFIWDLSIRGFRYLCGSWNQPPMDIEKTMDTEK